VAYRLLDAFRGLFDGKPYLHRRPGQGDWVSYHLYEDLHALAKSRLLVKRIESREHVLCVANRRQAIRARRGDGTFGDIVPGVAPKMAAGFTVARGPVATIEIGVEAKILAKAMNKQVGRVIGNLNEQVLEFKRRGGTPICVGIVGINRAPICTSFEGMNTCPKCGHVWPRTHVTDGKKHPHPCDEAPEAEARLMAEAEPQFDHFLILRYQATNAPPYRCDWVDYDRTSRDYGAILTRTSRQYDERRRTH